MPTLDASSPAGVYVANGGVNAVTTASFTPPAGSIIVAKAYAGDASLGFTNFTGTGLTFTTQFNVGTGVASPNQQARLALGTAVGQGSATTVSANFASNTQARGLLVEVWTAAQLAATPAVHTLLRTTNPSAPLDTLTTVGTGSVVSWMVGDYNGSTTTPTYRSSAVETGYNGGGAGPGTLRTAYQQAAVAGSQTYGMTAPTMSWYLGAVEIQAAVVATIRPTRRFVGQAVHRSNNF